MYLLYPVQLAAADGAMVTAGVWQELDYAYTRTWALMTEQPGASIRLFRPSGTRMTLYFHRHAWSGVVRITSGADSSEFSLFASEQAPDYFCGIDIPAASSDTTELTLTCTGRGEPGALGCQLWFLGARYGCKPMFFPGVRRYNLGGIGYARDLLTVNRDANCNIQTDIRTFDAYLGDLEGDYFRLSHTLEHIPAAETVTFLKKLRRYLAIGGRLEVIQSDASAAMRQWADGKISFRTLRSILFTCPGRQRENPLMTHYWMWGADDLREDLTALGFFACEFDAGSWSFDMVDEIQPETTRKDFGASIRNLGVRGDKLSGLLVNGRCHLDRHLSKYEQKIFSQNGEDGILLHLLASLEMDKGVFVEIGIASQSSPRDTAKPAGAFECNCWILQERGWRGTWVDAQPLPDVVPHVQARATAASINSLLERAGGTEVDVFSMDVGGQDYYIWERVAYTPKIVIIEYNASIAFGEVKCVVRDDAIRWDGTHDFGASYSAFIDLAKKKDYTCVYANGVNLFFVRSDLLANPGDFDPAEIYRHAIYHPPASSDRVWREV